ncbi:MAG: polysaccharide biosynthesis tyrosine autokinase [Bacteroidia bacterium]|nr:polysaccharide biosynthesis tyrosine autokinase [Bacteroidia bacterium]
MTNQDTEITEQGIDIKRFLFKLLIRWYLFVISFIIAFLTAYFYNRYSEPEYMVSSTLLIREKSDLSDGLKSILDNFGASNKSFQYENKLQTEIEILRSYNLIAQTIKELDFGIQYVGIGTIRNKELYKESVPFEVILDTSHQQLSGVKIYINILSAQKYFIEIKNHYNISKEMLFGEYFTTDYFKFKILLKHTELFNQQKPNFGHEGFYFIINNTTAVINEYLSKLSVSQTDKDAAVLILSSSGKVPQKEVDFLNKLGEVYIGYGLAEKSQIATNAIKFIDNQLEGIVDSLTIAEIRLQNFRLLNKSIIDISQEGQALFKKLEELQMEGSVLQIKSKYYDYLLNYIIGRKSDFKDIIAPSAIGINDPLLTSLIAELSKLYSEKSVIEYSAKENNPTLNVINIKIENAYNSLLENVRNIIKSTQISIDDNEKRLAETQQEIQKLPVTERQLINIQRKFELNDEIYTYLLEKRAEAGIAKASIISDNKVIDFARPERAANIFPRTNHNYMIAIICSLIIPLLIILLLDFFSEKIMEKKDVEDVTKIPIISTIGHNNQNNLIIADNKSRSIINNSFWNLKTNMQYVFLNTNHKSILVTSSSSGEGKTFCAINLAVIFSLIGKKTILIDCDLRKPAIHKYLNLNNSIGLSDYYLGKKTLQEIIVPSEQENLYIISSGSIPPIPYFLLGTDKTRELIEKIKKDFEYIIIDTPPISIVTDAIQLSAYSDTTIFLVRHNFTNRGALKLIDGLHNIKLFGNINIVINDVPLNTLAGYYAYSYGYAYKYGYGYNYNYYYSDDYAELKNETKSRKLLKRLFGNWMVK